MSSTTALSLLRAVAISSIGAVVFASALTPLVYSLLGYLLGSVPWPFSRVYNRVALLGVLIFLFYFRRYISAGRLRSYFACRSFRVAGIVLLAGALISLTSSVAALILAVPGSPLQWVLRPREYYLWRIIKLIPAALLISIIEETIFRAIIFKQLATKMKWSIAALLSSCLYAFVHFIQPLKSYTYEGFHLLAGFEYLAAIAERLLVPGLFPAMFGLFLAGMVLCDLLRRSNSLYLCIGLHSGWVIAMKAVVYATDTIPGAVFPPGPGRRYFLLTAPEAWISIIAVWLLAVLILSRTGKIASSPKSVG